MNMRICGVQYTTDTSCPAGYRVDTPCYSCTKCPSGAISEEGSTICKLCPAGRYSDGGSQCIDCPVGESSYGGALGKSSCSECLNWEFSVSASACTRLDFDDLNGWTISDLPVQLAEGKCPHNDGCKHRQNVFQISQEESTEFIDMATYTTDMATYTLEEAQRIEHFSFSYSEWSNGGGGIRLFDNHADMVLGISTHNSEVKVDDRDGLRRASYVPPSIKWIRVDIEIVWESYTFSITWSRVENGALIHTLKDGKLKKSNSKLKKSNSIKEIRWSKAGAEGWHANNAVDMQICGVQYAVNATCPIGYHLNATCSCSPCPPGTGSEQGSTICELCAPGMYSDAKLRCVRCPPGKSSVEGSSGKSSCFDCPAGTYSESTEGYCLPCPIGYTSHYGTVNQSACFKWKNTSSGGVVDLEFSENNGWTIKRESSIVREKCNCLLVESHCASTDIAWYILEDSLAIQHLQFYFECPDNTGSGILLLNEETKLELGVFTSGRELKINHANGFKSIRGVIIPYKMWIQVDIFIQWKPQRFSVVWTRLDDNSVIHMFTDGKMKHGQLIKKIKLSNEESRERPSSDIHFRDVRYVAADERCVHFDFENITKWDYGLSTVEQEVGTCPIRDTKANPLNSLRIRENYGSDSNDVASYTLKEASRIVHFSFFYYEWQNSDGGGIRLMNENGDLELGILTENSQFRIDDKEGVRQLNEETSGKFYDVWIHVDVEISWNTSEVSVTWSRGYDEEIIDTYIGGKLKHGDSIKKIRWANADKLGWGTESAIDMRICGVQYFMDATCPQGNRLLPCSSCSKCPSRTVSEEGSTICKLCPVGRYSDGGKHCRECPHGKSSFRGSSSESECFFATPTSSTTPNPSNSPSATSSSTNSPTTSPIHTPSESGTPSSTASASTLTPTTSPSYTTSESRTANSTSSASTIAPSHSSINGVNSAANSSGNVNDVLTTVMPIIPAALVMLLIGLVLFVRKRNRRNRGLQSDDIEVFSSQLGVSKENLKVLSGVSKDTDSGWVILEQYSDGLCLQNNYASSRRSGKSSSITVPSDTTEQNIEHINPLAAPQSQATKWNDTNARHGTDPSFKLRKETARKREVKPFHGSAIAGSEHYEGNASDTVHRMQNSSGPEAIFVHISSGPNSIPAEDVQVVSAAAPKLSSGTRSNTNDPPVQVALATNVDTSNMKRMEKTKLKLRVWRARLLAEPLPLVHVRVRNFGTGDTVPGSRRRQILPKDSGSGYIQGLPDFKPGQTGPLSSGSAHPANSFKQGREQTTESDRPRVLFQPVQSSRKKRRARH